MTSDGNNEKIRIQYNKQNNKLKKLKHYEENTFRYRRNGCNGSM